MNQDFWIKNGRCKTFDMKDEISNHKPFTKYIQEFKCWKLVNVNPQDNVFNLMKQLGFVLEQIPGSESKYL